MNPVMPTSYGLSYSTYSLPPSAWTIGLFSASASCISGACAPAQPRPQNSVTRPAPFRIEASASSSRGAGVDHRGWRQQPGRRRDGAWRRAAQFQVAGDHHHRDAAQPDRRADRVLQHVGKLGRVGHQFAIVAALAEQVLRMGFLEIPAADLRRRNLRGDGQHRHAAAVGIEQTVDQMQVARPARTGAGREFARDVRLAPPPRMPRLPRGAHAPRRYPPGGAARRSARSGCRRPRRISARRPPVSESRRSALRRSPSAALLPHGGFDQRRVECPWAFHRVAHTRTRRAALANRSLPNTPHRRKAASVKIAYGGMRLGIPPPSAHPTPMDCPQAFHREPPRQRLTAGSSPWLCLRPICSACSSGASFAAACAACSTLPLLANSVVSLS